ncbi:MAG: Ribosome-recycling factor [Microgenomates group bacterium GW2011_GWC1_41_8]|uniref:Ribosome-recycling factor n=3 Tax=Candidatus Roizmaniibacteriota TaxID=1752723 RepID=A0A0G0X5S8_9BACT|nr:MAG: Ribosome-recycling factor [Candidatus Levybacteria bacterium GW2011_GWA2_40_16]KKR71451.1 MAG: Ribosome-recycling factor [Candidatus Roizmanbacteria bacterium GW2011_GWB1_40_7]KKR92794.1 MAG: Ribosome-recycling factor [Candidatus Roizmanbacteria bacterium GW2011_GWA1_41_13]KKS20315.1 MAG: Ribosome-recycling factor [Candidatus Roizmanbacteria bacterium GW2011_GWC2_41_7]KKS23744.1 MAG: Ribosome-recycling factor [Microgenomates group bacterium GW2011_GWC1_41_8]OGK50650.1 MAG: ribosome rec
MDKTLQNAQKQMSQAITILREDLGTIRAGRASAALIEHVRIKVYGGSTELSLTELATISSSDAKTMVVSPFDQSIIDEIERGLTQANLGLTVSQDGQIIRVLVPPMTEERRQEFIKLAKTKTEGVHVMIRQARQEAMNQIKNKEQQSEISEDEKFRFEKEVQKITDEKTKEADDILNRKVNELVTL